MTNEQLSILSMNKTKANTTRQKRIDSISKILSRLYPGKDRICGCIGLECGRRDCQTWW